MAAQAVLHQIQQAVQPPQKQSFSEKYFARIALVVSAVALLILAPLDLFLGMAAGFLFDYFSQTPFKRGEDKVVTVPNTTFAIVGMAAALLRLTPAGATGGLLFHTIPFICSTAIGHTLYRTTK